MKTAENILNAAIGVQQQRGRAFGTYELISGEVCPGGALAVAAGHPADYWMGLQAIDPVEFDAGDRALVDAARCLAAVVAPGWCEASVELVVQHIGRWHDGERRPGDVAPKNSEVMTALRQAAELAAARAARALSLPEQTEEHAHV